MFKTTLLSMAWLVLYNGEPAAPTVQTDLLDVSSKCSLPAPKNIQWTSLGATNAFYAWDPVPGAAYYRVNVYIIPSKITHASILVPALPQMNGVYIDNLPSGTDIFVEVRSVCSNGIESSRLK